MPESNALIFFLRMTLICNAIDVVTRFKPDPPGKSSDDPGAGLMQMMQKMYNDGDDEMKRTLRKAWHESQEKKMKGEDPIY